ncbi:MAG: membrane protein insertion efficiency factor YidD [candidate division WOR-3 bacterium]
MFFILILALQYPKETNPVKIIFDTGITLYQKFISPSQGDVCNFSPSCSNFGRQAINKYGIFWGSLMTADRLMRCHPGAFDHCDSYYSGIKDYKVYDPIENNYIFGKIQKSDTLKSEW